MSILQRYQDYRYPYYYIVTKIHFFVASYLVKDTGIEHLYSLNIKLGDNIPHDVLEELFESGKIDFRYNEDRNEYQRILKEVNNIQTTFNSIQTTFNF